ncbi:MAG: hypothetical protein VCF24_20360 [Candidatus Latescibacterota bacterium]
MGQSYVQAVRTPDGTGIHFLVAAGLALLAPRTLAAHNGGVALASTLSDVVIDGRPDDWPDSLAFQTLSWTAYGRHPVDREDLQAQFPASARTPRGPCWSPWR